MKASLKSLLLTIVMGVTVVTVALLWLCAWSAHVRPEGASELWGVVPLAFPIFAVANGVMLVVWLALRPRYAIVPFIGFVACISDVRNYCPVNIPRHAPKGALSLMSYNVHNFDNTAGVTPEKRRIALNIARSGADIVCVQEGDCWDRWDVVEPIIRGVYPYAAVDGNAKSPDVTLRLFSKFPIITAERLMFPHSSNAAVAYRVKLPAGDTILIVNCHLQSDGFTPAEIAGYSGVVSGRERARDDQSRATMLAIVRKLASAAGRRCSQADTLRRFVERHADMPVLLCGDFNDTPVSYTHRQLTRPLADAYAATACGPGFSYSRHGMHVRIDNILYSPRHWEPFEARVDKLDKGSDHYPIKAQLRLKGK